MKAEYKILKEANLTNNCPVCYANDGMVISFKQKNLKSGLMLRTLKEVEDKIECSKCQSHIYPSLWTKDIELVYDYHRKTVVPSTGRISFTPLFYTIVVILFIIAAGAILYLKNPDLLSI